MLIKLQQTLAKPRTKLRGLGDAAALVAQPIAGVIDAIAGTDLRHCATCGQRQDDWNKAVPFNRK